MSHTTVNQMNLLSRTRSVVQQRYPDETILFSTAVTILETPNNSPTGWSLRRFLQRRGNMVVTDARVFVQSSFFSLLTIVWLAVIASTVYEFVQNGHSFNTVVAIVALIFIIQRRPYTRDLPFNAIRDVEFGSVRGMTARCDIMSIVLDGRAIQLVTAKNVPGDTRDRLLALHQQDSRN